MPALASIVLRQSTGLAINDVHPHKMAGRRVFDGCANSVYHMSLHYHLREELLRGDVVYDHVFTRITYGSYHPVHGYGRGHIHTDTGATVGDPSRQHPQIVQYHCEIEQHKPHRGISAGGKLTYLFCNPVSGLYAPALFVYFGNVCKSGLYLVYFKIRSKQIPVPERIILFGVLFGGYDHHMVALRLLLRTVYRCRALHSPPSYDSMISMMGPFLLACTLNFCFIFIITDMTSAV